MSKMTLGEFRDCHSELIEQFQWIEFNFKRIITNLTGKNILAGLEELKNESWGPLSIKVKQAESKYGITFIPDDVYDELNRMREERNYWCHQCYIDMRTQTVGDKILVKPLEFVLRLYNTLRDATELQERMTEIYFSVCREILK